MDGIKDIVYDEREERKQQMKDMTRDVALLKEWLREKIGQDWATATAPNLDSKLGVSDKYFPPWDMDKQNAQKQGSDSLEAYVKRIITTQVPWFKFLDH